MFTHADIWDAIDRLAQRNGLSVSGLAKKAGLSSTLFNPSKRENNKRKRWPSTESIAAVLNATNTTLGEFITLIHSSSNLPGPSLPLITYSEASKSEQLSPQNNTKTSFRKWDEMPLPASLAPGAIAMEIDSRLLDPIYPEGTILVISPTDKPRRQDRIVVKTKQGDVLVRLLGREGGQKIELLPLTPDVPPLTIKREDILCLCRILWASQ